MTPTCPATIIPSTWIARIHRQAPVPSSLSHRDIGLLFDRDQQSWRTIDEKTKAWVRTRDTFKWNEDQVYRKEQPLQHRIQVGQVYRYDNNQVYVVVAGHAEGCRVVPLSGGESPFFWKTEKVDASRLAPCETPVQVKNVPSLPQNGSTYIWDSQGDEKELPPQRGEIAINPETRVIVVGASWYTTRVRKEDAPKNGPTFRVFTHHLKRLV